MTEPQSAPPGWYLDGQDPRRRYWDGSQWTNHYEEPDQSQLPRPSSASEIIADVGYPTSSKKQRAFTSKREKPTKLSPEQLTAILNAEVARWTAKGWTLEATTTLFGRSAMLREPKWQAFLRDLLLVFVTAGLWLIYVIYRALVGKTSSKIITVDRFGQVKTFRRVDELYGD